MRLLVITYNLSISTFGYRVLLVHCMSRYTSPYGHNVVINVVVVTPLPCKMLVYYTI